MRHTPRRVLTTLATAAALAAGLLVSASGPAGAAVIVVNPGQSIQAAINGAPPGSTIQVRAGIYREHVEITKNGITVLGAGPGKTILERPGPITGQSPICYGGGTEAVDGFCIHGQFDQNGNQLSAVQNVRISGFTVRNFPEFGIFYVGATGAKTDNNVAANNGSYGIAAFNTSGETHSNETASGSGEAGFYFGDSPNAKVVANNLTAFNNGNGIFVRHAANGTLNNINSHDNCVGFLFLQQENGTHNWSLTNSKANHNDKACAGSGGGPPTSGLGVAIAGADSITVNGNQVNDNVAGGPSVFSAGIAVVSNNPNNGGGAPHNNTITHNSAYGNDPVDLFWDGTGTGNAFTGNTCGTSQPSGLCQ